MTEQNDQSSAKVLAELVAPEQDALRLAAILSGLVALIWLLQAALVAGALAGLLTDAAPLWSNVAGFALLGVLRAPLNHWAEGIAFAAGQRVTRQCRSDVVAREASPARALPPDLSQLWPRKSWTRCCPISAAMPRRGG